MPPDLPQVLDETSVLVLLLFRLWKSVHGRGVDGDEHIGRERALYRPAPEFVQANNPAEHRSGGRGAQADDDARLNHLELGLEPRAAGGNLCSRGFLMPAAFAVRLPFEMLHGVRDIDVVPRNAGFDERFVQQSSGRSDKGMARFVFLIPRLLPDEHDFGMVRALPEHGLSRALVQIAPGARLGGLVQRGPRQVSGKELGGSGKASHISPYHGRSCPCAGSVGSGSSSRKSVTVNVATPNCSSTRPRTT